MDATLAALAGALAGGLLALAGAWTGRRLSSPPEPPPPEPSRTHDHAEPWEPGQPHRTPGPDAVGDDWTPDAEDLDELATPGQELPDY